HRGGQHRGQPPLHLRRARASRAAAPARARRARLRAHARADRRRAGRPARRRRAAAARRRGRRADRRRRLRHGHALRRAAHVGLRPPPPSGRRAALHHRRRARRLLTRLKGPSMSTSSITLPFRLPRTRSRVLAVPRPELLALLALAAVLDLWALDRNGFANDYYSAAVRSMAHSWHAFLYGSFDAKGIMTVDKPPLSLWVQALSARVFGFSSWSLLVPQALMGVATVGLAYDLVRRRFGRGAGFGAGLALALTPVTVAISRHNNPDALLVLCSTAAVWFLARGLEDGRTRWLMLSGVSVGLGFEAKMAAALLVVPAIVAAWLWIAPRGRWAAVRQLAAGGAAMSVVGVAWPMLMWLTPAGDRPWVSGTSDNSIWSLILGYNGFGRLLGQDGGPGGGAGGPGGPGGGGPGGLFGGDPGALRLLN